MNPRYKNAQWIVTGHSLGGGVAEVFTNLVQNKQIPFGVSEISRYVSLRCVTFGPAPAIIKKTNSCFSKEIYSMYINGNDPVMRFNGDNVKHWASN